MQRLGYLFITSILFSGIILNNLIPTKFIELGDIKHDCLIDAESRLACGFPLRIKEVTLYDLELIAGISDLLGNRLIERKSAIINKARNYHLKDKHKAFEIVHGIGEAKAKKLAKDLLVE